MANGLNGNTESRNTAGEGRKEGSRTAEEIAQTVWSLFANAGSAVEQMMGTEDEVRLLRLRSKRNEVVVYPGKLKSLHRLV